MKKNIVISCGPIPARLDSVKFITNRFKGGLAFKTAAYFANNGYDVTLVCWKYTPLPVNVTGLIPENRIIRVSDVMEYYSWFEAHACDYDAFIMAAAVANLMPSKPLKGKFPSHKYSPGEKIDIPFEIAPRAIDVIKARNPRACLIGYKLFDGTRDELVEAARLTLKESKANLIVANHPASAAAEKLCVTADNAVVPCDWDAHLDMMRSCIDAVYYHTVIQPIKDPDDSGVRRALALAGMYEKTMTNGFGTVAVPVEGHPAAFATTARGHKGGPVIVWSVDHQTRTVYASAKATLNAPALSVIHMNCPDAVVVHRHTDDPRFQARTDMPAVIFPEYVFPGTDTEAWQMTRLFNTHTMDVRRIIQLFHGDFVIMKPEPVDWTKYREQFPERYFKPVPAIDKAVAALDVDQFSLELGAGVSSDCKCACDPYVKASNAFNLTLSEALNSYWDLVVCRNAVNYIPEDDLRAILKQCRQFMANTFLTAPDEKITDCELAVKTEIDGKPFIRHTLLLPDDRLVEHQFYAYDRAFYESLGLTVTAYGENSALLVKKS